MALVWTILMSAATSLPFWEKGICTDTRCGGAAKLCCEGSPALQHKDQCVESTDCDSCCGWNANHTEPDSTGYCTDTRCGGAAWECCEGSPALQPTEMCTTTADCDDCCGWKPGNKSVGYCTSTRCNESG